MVDEIARVTHEQFTTAVTRRTVVSVDVALEHGQHESVYVSLRLQLF